MKTDRMEAFSDGVIAIIITIMVLELKAPHDASMAALTPLLPTLLSYILSFIYLGIYWNNHHHMLRVTQRVSGSIMWANLHLLFWLSLIPFTTAWLGENHFASAPCALYGFILLMAAIAYWILQRCILAVHDRDFVLARALSRDFKGNISPLLYMAGILASFYIPVLALGLYAFVALLWIVPDRRIEKALNGAESAQ